MNVKELLNSVNSSVNKYQNYLSKERASMEFPDGKRIGTVIISQVKGSRKSSGISEIQTQNIMHKYLPGTIV